MSGVDHIAGVTYHGRRGAVRNAFRYSIDYILLDPETARGPALFSRDGRNLAGLRQRDHGGPPGAGRGAAWVREVLVAEGLGTLAGAEITLLAQPRILGHVFNPVSFWLIEEGGALRAVIAEVSNTFGDRHSYLCHHPGLSAIGPRDTLQAQKVFHVSPFQPVEGQYAFRFDITPQAISIRIDYAHGEERLLATLTGPREPLTNRAILRACLRRPFGSRRVLGLIHWQALKLWWKGARYRRRPDPPAREISR